MARRTSSLRTALLLVALTCPAWAVCGRTCASRPEGCGRGFGTVAYVVSTCRVLGTSQVGAQELRIHRAGCDPITVLRLANPEPVTDELGLCTLVGQNHLGTASPLAGAFQRLGVTPDGKGVVFEINNAFQRVGRTPLAPEQQGFFYVRANGRGLRRLGPPSRDRTYRFFNSSRGAGADVNSRIAISGDRRWMVFTDLAPGADGIETEQLFAINLATGSRRQVTHLTAGGPGRKIIYFVFGDARTILFQHRMGENVQGKRIRVDGTGFIDEPHPQDLPGGEGRVSQTFRRSGLRYGIVGVTFPGPAANADVLPDYGPPTELATLTPDGNLIQLTNFRYADMNLIGTAPHDVVFMTSADPVGANPYHNCQLFRISPLGLGLRQVTRFDQGRRSEEGCQIGSLPGCGIREVNGFDSASSPAFAFYSDCDPFGTNPNGSQVFTMRWNGSGLRQLTHTRGATTAADGSVVEVEIPGPVARGGRR